MASPESIAAVLVAILGAVLIATQALALQGTESSAPTPRPSAAPTASATMDPQVRNALVTALAVNQSLAATAAELDAAAAADPPLAPDIAALLRAVNSDLTAGDEAANRLVMADETAVLGEDLLRFYRAVLARNNETLGTTIRNVDAYVAGAVAISALLADLPALNDRITDALARRGAATPAPSGAPSAATPSTAPTPAVTPGPEPTAPPPTSPPPSRPPTSPGSSGPSLVENGDFEAGPDGWRLSVEPPAESAFATEPGAGIEGSTAARVEISEGSPARAGISLLSAPMSLQRGTTYVIEVWARSSAPRDVRVSLNDGAGQTTTARNFAIGASWTLLTFQATQLHADPSVVLGLDLGRSDATVWFDDVVVRVLGS
jgi:hypothetical protein